MKEFVSKTGKKFILRSPEIGDLNSLYKFISGLIAEDIYLLRGPEDTITLAQEEKWLKSKLKQIKDNEVVLIDAFFWEKVVGQVELEVGEFRGRHLGKIGIAIAKEFRGEGLGEKLMTEIESEARRLKLKILHLEVFAENTIAENLYKKLGYVEFGMLPKSIDYRGRMLDEKYLYKSLD